MAAIARFLWRRSRHPHVPSLAVRIWRWLLIMGDREMDNQRLRQQLAARDRMIGDLQADLDRALGIDSLRTSHDTGQSHPKSSEPTKPLRRKSSDTTG